MANDISGINSSKPQQTTTQRSSSQSNNSASPGAPSQSVDKSSSSADQVSLTQTAEKLKSLEKQLSQEAPVNEQKIARVRSALNNGEYQLDPENIARKMIDFESYLDD